MSLLAVTMYRVVCDEPGCNASPQDQSDYFAWADSGTPYDDAAGADWTIRPNFDLCPEHGHRTVCMGADEECPRRDELAEADDGWLYCPDHLAEGMDEATP